MSTASGDFGSVQGVALGRHIGKQRYVCHRVLRFDSVEAGKRLLRALAPRVAWGDDDPRQGLAIGLSFRGLQALGVPDGYLRVFRNLAPAFTAGAAVRASRFLGDVGASAPSQWEQAFAYGDADAVITLHGTDDGSPSSAMIDLPDGVAQVGDAIVGQRLGAPAGEAGEWVHFGYRDGIAKTRIRRGGVPDDSATHLAGELVLGAVRDSGDNPWSLVQLPQEMRDFFAHGTFGALRKMAQDQAAFDTDVRRWAKVLRDQRWSGSTAPLEAFERFVRAKLCGRWPSGQVTRPDDTPERAPSGDAGDDFDYAHDRHGTGCPYSSHIRRMNPRDADGVHVRPRPLFRRGMPYGPIYQPMLDPATGELIDDGVARGLVGLFFCASLEDQFEHLLGDWGDMRALGSVGDRGMKDPLVGEHERGTAAFLVPMRRGDGDTPDPDPLRLWNFRPYVRTCGTFYGFYPSREALHQIIEAKWLAEEEPWPMR